MTIKKSCLASLLIGFGVSVLLTLNNYLGILLFSFGLLGVCVLQAELYTGKAGYYWRSKKDFCDLIKILVVNITVGVFIGTVLAAANPAIFPIAIEKVAGWEFNLEYFLRAALCGSVMYICVDLYKKGCVYGIFLGVPIFIFCGFQHSIANAIIYGASISVDIITAGYFHIWFCALGNLVGAIITDILNN